MSHTYINFLLFCPYLFLVIFNDNPDLVCTKDITLLLFCAIPSDSPMSASSGFSGLSTSALFLFACASAIIGIPNSIDRLNKSCAICVY